MKNQKQSQYGVQIIPEDLLGYPGVMKGDKGLYYPHVHMLRFCQLRPVRRVLALRNMDKLCALTARRSIRENTRFTVVLRQGSVLKSSTRSLARMKGARGWYQYADKPVA